MRRGRRVELAVEVGREGSEEGKEGRAGCGEREGGMCGEEGGQD